MFEITFSKNFSSKTSSSDTELVETNGLVRFRWEHNNTVTFFSVEEVARKIKNQLKSDLVKLDINKIHRLVEFVLSNLNLPTIKPDPVILPTTSHGFLIDQATVETFMILQWFKNQECFIRTRRLDDDVWTWAGLLESLKVDKKSSHDSYDAQTAIRANIRHAVEEFRYECNLPLIASFDVSMAFHGLRPLYKKGNKSTMVFYATQFDQIPDKAYLMLDKEISGEDEIEVVLLKWDDTMKFDISKDFVNNDFVNLDSEVYIPTLDYICKNSTRTSDHDIISAYHAFQSFSKSMMNVDDEEAERIVDLGGRVLTSLDKIENSGK